jgi:hypothetical protein
MNNTHSLPHSQAENDQRDNGLSRCPSESDPGGRRTHDLRIKSPLLCQLSYRVGCCCAATYTNLHTPSPGRTRRPHPRP